MFFFCFFKVNIIMAYDTKTLQVLHGLTPEGKEKYQQFLEEEADKILYKAAHPVKYRIEAMLQFLANIIK